MLEFVNIHKQFQYKKSVVKALDGISFQISQGEIVAIVGPSGSGKSTLLNIAGGLLKPSSGEYLFNGQSVAGNDSELAKFRSEHVGFILQHFALIKSRSIRYNIGLPLKYSHMNKKEAKEHVETISDSLGISDKLDMYPHMLSGGECQRVAIARAVIAKPNLILADEPTSSLDDDNKFEVLEILKELNQSGITMLIATHDHTVSEICNREIQIKSGKMIGL